MVHVHKTTKKEYEKAIDMWFDVLGFAPCVKHFDFSEKEQVFDYELYDKDESVCDQCTSEFWLDTPQKFVNDEITTPEIKPESTSVPIENNDWLRAYT